MRTIGLLGGMSWESTIPYYRIINRTVADALGGLHSAKLLLYSFDFAEIEQLQRDDRFAEAGVLLGDAAARLARMGADFLVLCTNTMHCVAPAIESRSGLPLLHIADPTAVAIRERRLSRVGLLGTRFTMERDFYRGRFASSGLTVHVPEVDGRMRVHDIIYTELCRGVVSESSRAELLRVVEELEHMGAEGVILGCTELGLLLRAGDVQLPLFDTTELHARAAGLRALTE